MFQSPHVRLLVTKFPICFRFYRDILGFPARFGSEDGVYTEFEISDQILALYKRELMAEAVGTTDKSTIADAQDKGALILATDDVDAALAQPSSARPSSVTMTTTTGAMPIRTGDKTDGKTGDKTGDKIGVTTTAISGRTAAKISAMPDAISGETGIKTSVTDTAITAIFVRTIPIGTATADNKKPSEAI